MLSRLTVGAAGCLASWMVGFISVASEADLAEYQQPLIALGLILVMLSVAALIRASTNRKTERVSRETDATLAQRMMEWGN